MAYTYTRQLLKINGGKDLMSDFDRKLCVSWDLAMKSGVFRYDLSDVRYKIVEGPNHYQAMLNVKRATDRRKPEPMVSVKQPFDQSKFNFNQVKPEEVLFDITQASRSSTNTDKILVNVSPAEYGHSLIIPDGEKNLPQTLTLYAVKLALELMCLSSSSEFKIAFNSLCAFASVNHLHLHCFYSEQLRADTMRGAHLHSGLYKLATDAPLGFGFELRSIDEIPKVSRLVFTCANHLTEKNIAHCMFICRGCSFVDPSLPLVKILLWPCAKYIGSKKAGPPFYTAAFEMAGKLLMYDNIQYNTITDEAAHQILEQCSLSEREFNGLTDQLTHLINADFSV